MRNRPGEPVSGAPFFHYEYAPTVTQAGNTFSDQQAVAHLVPGLLFISGRFTSASAITATLTISLPSGVNCEGLNTSAAIQVGFISAGTNLFRLSISAPSNSLTAGSVTLAATFYQFSATVPVAMLG